MLAIRVTICGGSTALVDQDDWSILSVIVSARRAKGHHPKDEIELSLARLSDQSSQGFAEHFRYPNGGLIIGDLIELEIVKMERVDQPKGRY